MGQSQGYPVLIQNILNCVPKTNVAFTDLEGHGGKWKMTLSKHYFGMEYPFKGVNTYAMYLFKFFYINLWSCDNSVFFVNVLYGV